MTLYDQLGVEQTATGDEIKRAYFRLVRKHSPENDPEEFMRIRKAYEELSNPESRASYDREMSRYVGTPEVAAEILLEADRLYNNKLHDEAISLLQEKLREHTGDKRVTDSLEYTLCILYLETGKSGKAVTLAEELVKKNPLDVKILQLAVSACLERGWTNKANAYLKGLQQINPGSEDSIIPMLAGGIHSSHYMGKLVESIEQHGGKAPIICCCILSRCLSFDEIEEYDMQEAQLDLFSEVAADKQKGKQPWNDPIFVSKKLVESTFGMPSDKAEPFEVVLEFGVLKGMYDRDRYDILPQIDKVIGNIEAEHIFETSAYKVASVGHAALDAVAKGIPKPLAALSVARLFSKEREITENEHIDYRDEAITLEIEILIEYKRLKPEIKRFREEFYELYKYSEDFLDAINRYSEQRLYDEINRRLAKINENDRRLDLDWLGEDEYDFGVPDDIFGEEPYERKEPVRVVKIGRNEPCPCGSGLKYKKCCGK